MRNPRGGSSPPGDETQHRGTEETEGHGGVRERKWDGCHQARGGRTGRRDARTYSPFGRATMKVMLLTAVWPCHCAVTVAVAGPGQEVCGRQLQAKSPLPFACFTPCRLLLFATWPQAYTMRMLRAAPGRVWTHTCPAPR